MNSLIPSKSMSKEEKGVPRYAASALWPMAYFCPRERKNKRRHANVCLFLTKTERSTPNFRVQLGGGGQTILPLDIEVTGIKVRAFVSDISAL
jgi:hypothetical protein